MEHTCDICQSEREAMERGTTRSSKELTQALAIIIIITLAYAMFYAWTHIKI